MTSRWFKKKCSSMPDFFHEGEAQVDGYLKNLEVCTATVGSLCIYETPLQQGPAQALGTIQHHLLVVTVITISHPTRGDVGGLLIRAEKAGPDEHGKNTGIIVRHVPYVHEENHNVRHRVDDLDVKIPMDQLLKILTSHSPDYDLVTDNCWRYAHATCRALLEVFRDLGSDNLGSDNRSLMNRHLEEIPALVMPLETVMKVTGYGILIAAATVSLVFVYESLSAYFGGEDEEQRSEPSSESETS